MSYHRSVHWIKSWKVLVLGALIVCIIQKPGESADNVRVVERHQNLNQPTETESNRNDTRISNSRSTCKPKKLNGYFYFATTLLEKIPAIIRIRRAQKSRRSSAAKFPSRNFETAKGLPVSRSRGEVILKNFMNNYLESGAETKLIPSPFTSH